uniref:Uncharacterized protein n=1 Tax=Panagrolaimus sp. ES5 TaxID=591445 RepID=A0AC34FFG7_9BILA
MFLYRLQAASKEKKIPTQQNSETSLNLSRITNLKGKNKLTNDSVPTTSKSINNSFYDSFSPKPTVDIRSPPKVDPSFERKLEQWREKNAAEKVSDNKKRRLPAWDEVEMRRHGLVNRFCNRVYGNECPSNPSTVDVSIYDGKNASTPCSQDSFRCTLPDVSSSYYSNFSNPLATSTPRSGYAESTTRTIDEKDDVKSLSPIPKRDQSFAQSVVSQYVPGPLNNTSQQLQRQQFDASQPNQGHQVVAQAPSMTSPMKQSSTPEFVKTASTQVSSNSQRTPNLQSPEPQSIQQPNFDAKSLSPIPKGDQSFAQSVVSQYALEPLNEASQQLQRQQSNSQPTPNLQSPGPQSLQKTAPTQTTSNSQPSQNSVYMESALHNSTYAFQKPGY